MIPAGIRPSCRYQAPGATSVSVQTVPVPSESGSRVEPHDAVGEQQRRLGHPDAAAQAVLVGEERAEDFGDAPAGVDLQGTPVEYQG